MFTSSVAIPLKAINSVKLYNDHINRLFLNVRSLKAPNKFDKVKEIIDIYEKINIVCLAETWLQDPDAQFYNIPGFTAHHFNRSHMRGGGVSCYINNQILCLQSIMVGNPSQIMVLKLRANLRYDFNLVT